MTDGFDFKELSKFEEDLIHLAHNIKGGKPAKQFLGRSGTKLRKSTLEDAKSKVNKNTGDLFKGIKRGKVYKYYKDGSMAIRVYGGKPASHAHLVNNGHRIVVNGEEKGFVKGKHFMEGGLKNYENEYEKDLDNFLDEMLKEL